MSCSLRFIRHLTLHCLLCNILYFATEASGEHCLWPLRYCSGNISVPWRRSNQHIVGPTDGGCTSPMLPGRRENVPIPSLSKGHKKGGDKDAKCKSSLHLPRQTQHKKREDGGMCRLWCHTHCVEIPSQVLKGKIRWTCPNCKH